MVAAIDSNRQAVRVNRPYLNPQNNRSKKSKYENNIKKIVSVYAD